MPIPGRDRHQAKRIRFAGLCRLLGCGYTGYMEIPASIQCPFCGQVFEVVVDTSVASQRFTTDCEICCHPFEIIAECAPGEILELEVKAG
jgi:hypothetical protein